MRGSIFDCEHDWRAIPFWHPNRWADHWGWRCRNCGVVRDESPGVWSVRLWLLWRVGLFGFAGYGVLSLTWRVLGH